MLTKAQYHHDQQSSEHESLQSCMACDQQYKLKHRSHTPEFLRRPFILTGYRVYLSYANCLKSFFHLHNESVNVWTHAIGVVYIIYRYIACILMWQLLTSNQVQASDKSSVYNNNSSTTPYLDLGIFSLFYLAALTMLTCSSTYHLCCCHSESAHSDLLNIDMLGIVVMIYGTYIAGLYAAFSCSPFIQAYYMLALTVAVVVCVCILKATKVKEAEYRWLRVSSLLLVIMYAVNPIYYWFQLSPPFQLTEFSGHVFVMLMCYAIGFSFYSSKLPEAKRPGYFDIWFSSHQLW